MTEPQTPARAMEKIREALPGLGGVPSVNQMAFELGLDQNGGPAVFITIVLDNPGSEDAVWEQSLLRLNRLIWQTFREEDVAALPYTQFRLVKESELSEDEEPATETLHS